MNCVDYIENFLSAHADRELTTAELREAEEHLRKCLGCRGKLEDELAMKRLLRERIQMRRVPAEVRRNLLETLDRVAAEEEAKRADARGPSADRRGARSLRRAAMWAPFVLAASIVIFFLTKRELTREPPLPLPTAATLAQSRDFDATIAALKRFQQSFQPNVPSASPGDIQMAYASAGMPDFLWNFSGSGLALKGGRIEQLPDGRKVAYTLYQGARGSLLCARFKAANAPPPGTVQKLDGHHFYTYRGYSVCYTYVGDGGFVCILASRLPLDQMVKAVKIAFK